MTIAIAADPTTNENLRNAATPANIVPADTLQYGETTVYRGEIYIAADDMFYTYAVSRSALIPGASAAVTPPYGATVVADDVTAFMLYAVCRDIAAGI